MNSSFFYQPGCGLEVDNYLTEQQQLDQIKQWWKKNGAFTTLLVLFLVVANIGWQVWRHHREKMLTHASNHFEWLMDGVMSNNPVVVQAQTRYILKRYPHTPYALMAALMQARQAVNENDLPGAEEKLTWVLEHAQNKSLKQVARLRAARVILAENKPDQALELLKKVDDANYLPAIESLQGDIYFAKGEKEQARDAYQKSVQSLNEQDTAQPLLQMKLDDLAS